MFLQVLFEEKFEGSQLDVKKWKFSDPGPWRCSLEHDDVKDSKHAHYYRRCADPLSAHNSWNTLNVIEQMPEECIVEVGSLICWPECAFIGTCDGSCVVLMGRCVQFDMRIVKARGTSEIKLTFPMGIILRSDNAHNFYWCTWSGGFTKKGDSAIVVWISVHLLCGCILVHHLIRSNNVSTMFSGGWQVAQPENGAEPVPPQCV